MASSDPTPAVGTPSARAMPFAVATPTRDPVNDPGPDVAGDALDGPRA